MGIHNESGVAKIALPRMSELVDSLLTRITDINDKDASFVPFQRKSQGYESLRCTAHAR